MTNAFKEEFESLIQERIKEVERQAETAYAQKRQANMDTLFSFFQTYKAKHDKVLARYENKCTAYSKQLLELSERYEELKTHSARMNQSFRALHVKLLERMNQVADLLGGFRQAMLAAWQKERHVLLGDLKEGWQKDKEEAAKLVEEAEKKRCGVEGRAAALAQELVQRQQEWNQRVSELVLRQRQIMKSMAQYWTVFEKWLRQNVTSEDELSSLYHSAPDSTFETSAQQLDMCLRKCKSEHPHVLEQLLDKYFLGHEYLAKRNLARAPPPTPMRKTRQCKFWLLGQCKYGENCTFFHEQNPTDL